MSKQIWVRKEHEVRGPFSVAQIRQLADEGELTPDHEISSDRKRWKAAGDVAGLGLAKTDGSAHPPGRDSEGDIGDHLAAVARSAGTQVALGVLLLVVIALMVAGACLIKLGPLNGLVFTTVFLLTAALGYPSACFGRDVSAIYVLVTAVVCLMLLGEAPVGFDATLGSWLGMAASLIPGILIVIGWKLIARGLGHDNETPESAPFNPSRFSPVPVSEKDRRRAMAAIGGKPQADAADRVRLRLDPDDWDRAEDSLGDVLEQEARRSGPGVAVSFVFHAVLLLALAIWQLRGEVSPGDLTVELGWKTISPKEQTIETPPEEEEDVELQAVKINQEKPDEPDEEPLQPLEPVEKEAKPAVPVKPVDVGGLFEGRDEANRRRILDRDGENSQSVEQAIWQGLSWLQRHQQAAGNWQLHEGYPDASDWPQLKTDTGATALALLAFLGNGQTHKEAKNEATQEVVQKGLDWLIGIQNRNGNGDFHDLSSEQGRQPAFYAHSQATIAICEAYAMTKDRTLYEPARRGVDYLLKSQQPNQGGWKYQPLDARSIGDLSVTGWALMALHSARAAGIDVPEESFQRASMFLDSVQEKDGARYKYQPDGWDVTRAMTAEGLLCRQFLGWPRTQPQLQDGLDYLLDDKYRPQWSEGRRNVYEWYYVGHVLHNMNDEEWTDWYNTVQQEIVKNQITGGSGGFRGSWHPHRPQGAPYEHADKAGRLYLTAMCLLILETPMRHQPIYGD